MLLTMNILKLSLLIPMLGFLGCSSGFKKDNSEFGSKADPRHVEPDSRVSKGIVYSNRSADSNVQNGTAYDFALFDLDTHDTIVIPSRAQLKKTKKGKTIRIAISKRLGLMGHPVETISIDETRKRMGCAQRTEGRKLYLATYGEFSCIEGGQRLELMILVPQGIKVERDDSQEMSRESDSGATSSNLEKSEEGEWYTPYESKQKWLPIPDQPDIARAAQKMESDQSKKQSGQ